VANRWSGLFESISCRMDLIENVQDLNIMIKAAA